MKSMWNSFKIAFSMFSKIPMPQADWTKENMKYMFVFFPWIGIVIGGLTIIAAYLGNQFGFQMDFINIILVLIPVFVTGGIHVDGLLDTADAMSSWRDRKKRLEILKDSHAGAFAVITACVYFLLWFAAFSQINGSMNVLYIMGFTFVISRCFSALGVLTLPKAKEDGTVAEFSRQSENITVRNILIIYLIIISCFMIYIDLFLSIGAMVTAIGVYFYYRSFAMKNFGGTTGDLSGYFLCICELCSAIILAIISNFKG